MIIASAYNQRAYALSGFCSLWALLCSFNVTFAAEEQVLFLVDDNVYAKVWNPQQNNCSGTTEKFKRSLCTTDSRQQTRSTREGQTI